VHNRPKRLREIRVPHRIWRRAVDVTRHWFMSCRVQEKCGYIMDMHSRHPLPAGAQFSAQAEPENRSHQRQGAAVIPEHHRHPDGADGHAKQGRSLRLCLPSHRDISQKAVRAEPGRLVRVRHRFIRTPGVGHDFVALPNGQLDDFERPT
jgi:hypothetical protein